MKFFMISGDERMRYARECLKAEGHEFTDGKDFETSALLADAFILGTPATKDGKNLYNAHYPVTFESVLNFKKPVLGGYMKFDDCHAGTKIIDYAQTDAFTIENALPSAEGCIEIALHNMPSTLSGSTCLVTGFGRFGECLARKLKALDAIVFASARSESAFAKMRTEGIFAIHNADIIHYAEKFDLIINTIPHIIITRPVLEKVKREALIIEAASSPGGIDKDTAQRLGHNIISAPGLPGKCAPKSAGEIIARAIINSLGDL